MIKITATISAELVAENALLLLWPEHIHIQQHQEIIAREKQIKTLLAKALIETVSSYNSLIIYYQFDKITTPNLILKLTDLLHSPIAESNSTNNTNKQIEIPVYYGLDVGLDLLEVSKKTGLTVDEIIKLHSEMPYHAFALGFTPGFCYLASTNQKLQLPRKATPRKQVPAGSVAIAEQQTAVYPNASPGGWYILGQTPYAMYQSANDDFTTTISLGDTVKFTPINKAEFIALGGVLPNE